MTDSTQPDHPTPLESSDTATKKRRPRVGLFTMNLIGLAAGIGCGLFLGEYAERLKIVGDGFVGLLRMSVLPYIVVSLIANVGKLSLRQGSRLFFKGGIVMVVLWAISLLTIAVFAQALPAWKSGSFFSTAIVEDPQPINLVELFIPSNIFESLAEEAVPAVIVFCVIVGVAIASLAAKRDKTGKKIRKMLVVQLELLAKALAQVNHFIVRLTPIGIFAIAAHAAGTLSLADLGRLQAYIITYATASMLLTFVVFPALIITLTPFRYRDVLFVSKDALVMAFVTGKLIVVLPLLIEKSEQLFQRRYPPRSDADDSAPAVDVVYPLAYSLPNAGRLLSVLFIPFAAWFLGHALTGEDYPRLLGAGMISSFGGPILSTPFLLDMMYLPHDMFQLFLLSGVLCGRLADMLGVMHLAAFAMVTTCAFTGRLRLNVRRIGVFAVVTILCATIVSAGTRQALRFTLAYVEPRDEVIGRMQLLDEPVEAIVFEHPEPNRVSLLPNQSILDRVRERGVIRIGYNTDRLPFAYRNLRGDLVGYDINMAHVLARDLGVTLEFVPWQQGKLLEQFDNDHFDVVMSGLVGTLQRSEQIGHTKPYMDVTLALVVEDYRARQFRDPHNVRAMPDLRIGYLDVHRGFVKRLEAMLPSAKLIELKSNREFFEGDREALDALLISAESGSAYTLLYPDFEVVVPRGKKASMPLVYGIANRDEEMQRFMDYWLDLRTKDGTVREHYEHWILGRGPVDDQPRWSILRNVLGWVP